MFLADARHAVARSAAADHGQQLLGSRKSRLVHEQIVADLAVGLHQSLDPLRRRAIGEVHRRGGHQGFGVPLIGVEQKPNQRHRIVRLVLDVGQHDHPRPRGGGLGEDGLSGADRADQPDHANDGETDSTPKRRVHAAHGPLFP